MKEHLASKIIIIISEVKWMYHTLWDSIWLPDQESETYTIMSHHSKGFRIPKSTVSTIRIKFVSEEIIGMLSAYTCKMPKSWS